MFFSIAVLHPSPPPGYFTKSLKTLLALAAGLPIINPSWVDACHQSGLLIRVAEGHIASNTQKERELKFSVWGTLQRVQQQGRVLECRTGAGGQGASVPRRCILCPGLREAEKETDTSALPLIIQVAGGELLTEVRGKKSDFEDCLVFGVIGDRAWAKKFLPAGKAVYAKPALIDSVMRGGLVLDSPLFTV